MSGRGHDMGRRMCLFLQAEVLGLWEKLSKPKFAYELVQLFVGVLQAVLYRVCSVAVPLCMYTLRAVLRL